MMPPALCRGREGRRSGMDREKHSRRLRGRLALWLRHWGADLLLSLGALLASTGAGWIYPPAGLIAAGASLIAGGVLCARGGDKP